MSATAKVLQRYKFGNGWMNLIELKIDESDYSSGGEELDEDTIGLNVLHNIAIQPVDGYVFEYDYDNSKVKAMVGGGDTNVGKELAENASIDITTYATVLGY